jgi:hypothetical protein
MGIFKPKIGEQYFYFKFCGVVRAGIWLGHKEQKRQVLFGRAPFRSEDEAKEAYQKQH